MVECLVPSQLEWKEQRVLVLSTLSASVSRIHGVIKSHEHAVYYKIYFVKCFILDYK